MKWFLTKSSYTLQYDDLYCFTPSRHTHTHTHTCTHTHTHAHAHTHIPPETLLAIHASSQSPGALLKMARCLTDTLAFLLDSSLQYTSTVS